MPLRLPMLRGPHPPDRHQDKLLNLALRGWGLTRDQQAGPAGGSGCRGGERHLDLVPTHRDHRDALLPGRLKCLIGDLVFMRVTRAGAA
ncbi:hypothetical protein [Amycolatopsis saalfeldensis]|uniref:Uncharacterized protein n=1 Tax=Amycolatopsis saalfeldensis TaxID=394193 RepID=A0A1H8YPI3_9PSEU|nr:hypothetical protein [Amycolatopsis saalfeldensis]SEP54080.1 hypothetical protein SAMN04489732_13637 [Amycolatopsis saalfeldensis]